AIQFLSAARARSPSRPVRSTDWASWSRETPALPASTLSVSPLSLTGRSLPCSLLARGSRRRRGCPGALAALDAFLLVRVPAEGAADRELPELVAHHVLGDEHVQEGPPVVDLERVADELGDDGAAPGPGLDGLLAARGVHTLDLAVELLLD